MAGIGAPVQVLRVQFLALGMGQEIGQELLEGARGERPVIVPPDLRLRVGIAHHELVLRGAARVHPRLGEERAAMGETRFAAPQ